MEYDLLGSVERILTGVKGGRKTEKSDTDFGKSGKDSETIGFGSSGRFSDNNDGNGISMKCAGSKGNECLEKSIGDIGYGKSGKGIGEIGVNRSGKLDREDRTRLDELINDENSLLTESYSELSGGSGKIRPTETPSMTVVNSAAATHTESPQTKEAPIAGGNGTTAAEGSGYNDPISSSHSQTHSPVGASPTSEAESSVTGVGASPTPHIWLDCKAIEALLDERISKGKTVPAIKEKLLPLIDLINADCKISDNGIGKATALLVALIESIPEVKLFNEAVKKEEEKFIDPEDDFMHYETDQEALKLHRRGIALSKEKGIPYIRAILEITAEARRR